MKVYILNHGWLECDENWMVSMKVVGTKNDKNPKLSWIQIPIYSVLIDHPTGKILYDTGCNLSHQSDEAFPYFCTEEQTISQQLALIGVVPEEINTVVLSHMHYDHIGNIELFSNAEIFVPQKDFEYSMNKKETCKEQDCFPYTFEYMNIDENNIHMVDDDISITDGVNLINLPGHAPGILGLQLELENDNLFFVQDAVYNSTNYGPPERLPGIIYDSVEYFSSIKKIKSIEKNYKVTVVFGHDMDQFNGLKHAPEFYR